MPAERLKDGFEQLRFDPSFPFLQPIALIFVSGIVFRKRGFQRESNGERFFFLVHTIPVVAIQSA
jgi:hypothetical protein